MGGRIIITADAHTPEGILAKYQNAIDLAKSAGFTHTVLLTSQGSVDCPI
jgi:histidinol-phosphatase (PHP family)